MAFRHGLSNHDIHSLAVPLMRLTASQGSTCHNLMSTISSHMLPRALATGLGITVFLMGEFILHSTAKLTRVELSMLYLKIGFVSRIDEEKLLNQIPHSLRVKAHQAGWIRCYIFPKSHLQKRHTHTHRGKTKLIFLKTLTSGNFYGALMNKTLAINSSSGIIVSMLGWIVSRTSV